jgi:hypothetical protein
MQDAEEAPDSAEQAIAGARRPWSTPTVILSTLRKTSAGPCSTTQSVGDIEIKHPKSTPGTTSVHS